MIIETAEFLKDADECLGDSNGQNDKFWQYKNGVYWQGV